MDWKQLDFPTRAAVVAGVMALVGALVPLLSVAAATVAIVFSGVALWRARTRGEPNPVARVCLFGSLGLIAFLVIGNAIYSSAA